MTFPSRTRVLLSLGIVFVAWFAFWQDRDRSRTSARPGPPRTPVASADSTTATGSWGAAPPSGSDWPSGPRPPELQIAPFGAAPSDEGAGDHHTLLRATWGSGQGQLGRTRPAEANPEAASAFTVDASGRLLVVDKVNGRLVRYDRSGQPIGSFASPLRSPQEVLTTPDGSILLMDRLADKSVAILDENGRLKGRLPVVGKGVEQGGQTTGLFHDAEGIYVEVDHSQVVRIGDASGNADEARPTLDGRPSRDGKTLLSARLVDRSDGSFSVRAVDRASGETLFQKQIAIGVPVQSIVFLDSDAAGGIYAGVHAGREVEPGQMVDEAVRIVCLGPKSDVRGTVVLPANTMPEESFRDVSVRNDGSILYMERTETGVVIASHHCG